MLLPLDDSLLLSDNNYSFTLTDISEPIALTLEDLKGFLPAYARKNDSFLRDTWLQVWGTMANYLWTRYGLVLDSQISPRFAEGIWLDALGELLGKLRIPNEKDPDYRARLLISIDTVSPNAIKAAVSQVLATFLPNASIPINYQEPLIDMAHCQPASTSDTAILHSSQVHTVPVWAAFTQPQVNTSGVASLHQTVYDNVNFRLWAYYPDQPLKKIGAFSVPKNSPQFWIDIPGNVDDTSDSPFSEKSDTLPQDYLSFCFTQGINGESTLHQTVVTGVDSPSDPYGTVPGKTDSLIDRFIYEIERRRAAGVSWFMLFDYPLSSQF